MLLIFFGLAGEGNVHQLAVFLVTENLYTTKIIQPKKNKKFVSNNQRFPYLETKNSRLCGKELAWKLKPLRFFFLF